MYKTDTALGSSMLSAGGVAAKFVPEDTYGWLCGFAAGQGLALGLRRAAGSAPGTRGAIPSVAGLSLPRLALLPWLSKHCRLALLDQAALHPISSSFPPHAPAIAWQTKTKASAAPCQGEIKHSLVIGRWRAATCRALVACSSPTRCQQPSR